MFTLNLPSVSSSTLCQPLTGLASPPNLPSTKPAARIRFNSLGQVGHPHPEAPSTCMVYTQALERLPSHNFEVCLCVSYSYTSTPWGKKRTWGSDHRLRRPARTAADPQLLSMPPSEVYPARAVPGGPWDVACVTTHNWASNPNYNCGSLQKAGDGTTDGATGLLS